MGAGRGADPKLAPPPAGPIVLKPAYAKAYEARRAADAEATTRGEPPATAAVLCRPYGMPRMMAVASYPVEILQTPGQITIVTEAFSEVRRVYPQPAAAADRRGAAWLLRPLGRPMGWRHARHRHRRHQGIGPGLQRDPAQRPDADHRADAARHAGRPARSDHDRRSGRAREAGDLHARLSPACRTTRWWSSSARTTASTSTNRAGCG